MKDLLDEFGVTENQIIENQQAEITKLKKLVELWEARYTNMEIMYNNMKG